MTEASTGSMILVMSVIEEVQQPSCWTRQLKRGVNGKWGFVCPL